MDAKALKEITSELCLLYVEDNAILREETSKLFGHLFKQVHTAENGKIGLELFIQGNYDLIITDVNMPVMNGVELCRKAREINPDIAIIITSAHDESRFLLELIDIGINQFILKPLNMAKFTSTLLDTCRNIINKKLVLKYKQELEENNIKLKQSNDKLEHLIKTLETKPQVQNIL